MDYYRGPEYCKISHFYDTVTKECRVHQPICELFQINTKILDYLMAIPNLFEKLCLPNVLTTYQKCNSRDGFADKFQTVWVFASISTILKAIIDGKDYESDLAEEFYRRCKLNRFLIGRKISTVEDIWKKMNFDADIQSVLVIITPFVGECKCNRTSVNYDFAVNNYRLPLERIDIIEKIIWETKLNDFFYFINVTNKFIEYRNKIYHAPVPCKVIPIYNFDEKIIIRILNYFQQNPDAKFLYIYPGGYIGANKLRCYLPGEKINIDLVHKPNTCFVCDKYDVKTIININATTCTTIKIEEPVDNCACKKCKKKISKLLDLECITQFKLIDKVLDGKTNGEKITNINHLTFGTKFNNNIANYFEGYPYISRDNPFSRRYQTDNVCKYRWSIPLLLIISNIYDLTSAFSLLPADIIYDIILSTYWHISNTITDISNESVNDTQMILYSTYRPDFL